MANESLRVQCGPTRRSRCSNSHSKAYTEYLKSPEGPSHPSRHPQRRHSTRPGSHAAIRADAQVGSSSNETRGSGCQTYAGEAASRFSAQKRRHSQESIGSQSTARQSAILHKLLMYLLGALVTTCDGRMNAGTARKPSPPTIRKTQTTAKKAPPVSSRLAALATPKQAPKTRASTRAQPVEPRPATARRPSTVTRPPSTRPKTSRTAKPSTTPRNAVRPPLTARKASPRRGYPQAMQEQPTTAKRPATRRDPPANAESNRRTQNRAGKTKAAAVSKEPAGVAVPDTSLANDLFSASPSSPGSPLMPKFDDLFTQEAMGLAELMHPTPTKPAESGCKPAESRNTEFESLSALAIKTPGKSHDQLIHSMAGANEIMSSLNLEELCGICCIIIHFDLDR
eukprot:scaffold225922_cov40-Prasinocladus_malaysianus.AAC.1